MTTPLKSARPAVLVHSSDEMYGSDRMVLQVVRSMPQHLRERLVVVLPESVDGPGELTRALVAGGVEVRHRALPILRRKQLASPTGLLLLVWRTTSLAWSFRRDRVDLVYAATSAAAPALAAARMASVERTYAHVQELWGRREGRALGLMVGLATTVIAISSAVRDAMPMKIGQRAIVVENGIDTPAMPVVTRPGHGLPRFLVASRWNAWKGHRTLLDAWDVDEPFGVLVIAGAAPSAGEGVDVPAIVAAMRNPESVEVVGQTDSIFDLLDEVDALIVPSDKPEPFGLVAIEAFSRSRAVIGSDGGGLNDIIDEGINGMKFTPGDSVGLRRILGSAQIAMLAAQGKAGLEKYSSQYSAEAFSKRMRQVWI